MLGLTIKNRYRSGLGLRAATDGVEVTEITTYDRDGNPVETVYRVWGETYQTLKRAMKAAR